MNSGPFNLVLAAQANYADLMERFSSAILFLDPETLLPVEANFKAEQVLGHERPGLYQLDLSTLFPSADWARFEKLARKARRNNYSYDLDEVELNLPQGKQWMRIETLALKLPEREVIQVIFFDIQKQKTTELENQRLSTTDALTGLRNRRFFDERLAEELARAARKQTPFGLILLDVDNFKHYNDQHGHPAGDTLLTELGQLIKDTVRTIDHPCRYGGEEFAILCPETDLAGLHILAERLRIAVAAHEFAFRQQQPLGTVSVSIGLGIFPDAGASAQSLKEAVDQALYASKKSGRNRVSAAQAA